MTPKQATMRVDLEILRELLRLPDDTTILTIRPCPANARQVIVEIQGHSLPDADEVVANISFEHTTILKFNKWEKVK